MNIKKYISIFVILAVLFVIRVYAADNQSGKIGIQLGGNMPLQGQIRGQLGGLTGNQRPMITGTVTEISGNTITIDSKKFTSGATKDTKGTETDVTYTVNASSATF